VRRTSIVILASVVMLGWTIVRAQSNGKAEAEVKEAETAWVKAATTNDQGAFGSLLAPKLVYTHATGLVEGKAEYMKAVDSFQKYTAIDLKNLRVNVYGNTAIVNARARMVGTTRGTPFDNQLLLIHVWVKQGGKWQLAAHQTTRLNP
jgi:ketosteroid isomerase-like protein